MVFFFQVAKLVLDDFFSTNDFEAGASFLTPSQVSTPLNPFVPSLIPQAHKLVSSSPFVDSGVSLDLLSQSQNTANNNSYEIDDDVFIVDNGKLNFCELNLSKTRILD